MFQAFSSLCRVGSYKRRKIGTNRIVAFVPDDGDVVQGNAVVPYVSSYKKKKIETHRIVAFVPDDGDVVQGNAVVPEVGSYKSRKVGCARTYARLCLHDEVVQGNAVVPDVCCYSKRKIGTGRIDAVVPARRGLAGQHGRARQEEEDRTRLSTGMKKRRGKRK